MTKATKNGNCQVCGRLQAYARSRVAKHGYTVEGYFHGICDGSDSAPMQNERTMTDRYVAGYRKASAKAAADAIAPAPATIEIRDGFSPKSPMITIDATDHRFARAVQSYRWGRESSAKMFAKFADDLEALANAVHGQPLPDRKVDDDAKPLRREFADRREAFKFAAEQNAAGKRATVRRPRYGFGATVFVREAKA